MYHFFKRLIDIFISIVLLSVASPLVLIFLAYIFFETGRNPFFKQVRVGIYRQPFVILKVRTIKKIKPSKSENLIPEFQYLRFGALMRTMYFDELPQLLNVLIGNMSIVGPRPHIETESEKLFDWCPERFEVLPGLTGLAQISGGSALSLESKSKLDSRYVRNLSIIADLKIMASTFSLVSTHFASLSLKLKITKSK